MITALPQTARATIAATTGGSISWEIIMLLAIVAVATIAVAWLFSSSGSSSD
ncbi:hypothetical protein ACFQH6_02025 [Halobacteriaceae archaeon GCM10025711]